jgi:hypothetical protein
MGVLTGAIAEIDAELRGPETISFLKIAISLNCDTQRSQHLLKRR